MTGMAGRLGRTLLRYGLKTLLLLLAVSVVAFALVSMSPVDPVQQYVLGVGGVSAEQRQELEEYWGVNDRGGAVHELAERAPSRRLRPVPPVPPSGFGAHWRAVLQSLALMLCAWLFSGLLGFGLGCVMGMCRDRLPDRILKKICYILSSIPTFWLGLVLLLVFSVALGWFPLGFSTPIGALNSQVPSGSGCITCFCRPSP